MDVNEAYVPVRMAADSSYTVKNSTVLGGFLCTDAGTLALADVDGNALIAATAVTAGQPIPFPIRLVKKGAVVTLAGGASGTLFIL